MVRRRIVELYYKKRPVPPELIHSLHNFLHLLVHIPKKDGKCSFVVDEQRIVHADITYEIEELKKDIYFLEHPETEFYGYLEQLHTGFSHQIEQVESVLKDVNITTFITDRDGTVNNYCGRYRSSIQSIYNAVFLTCFATRRARNSIILTSAPLDNGGVVDMSVNPEGIFVYAGSKGREYLDKRGARNQLPVEEEKQKRLDALNARLAELVKDQKYELFSLIGSGLQFKFGQTTIARQDIYNSVPEQESEDFLNIVKTMVCENDPEGEYFRIEDTGKDIEIILTVQSTQKPYNGKDFDKGDGVLFLNSRLGLHLEEGINLICGDTRSDIPMVQASMEQTENTWTVFVTENPSLQQEVRQVCPNSLFVSQPDALVTLFNNLGQKESV